MSQEKRLGPVESCIKFCELCGSPLEDYVVGITYDPKSGEEIKYIDKRCTRIITEHWIGSRLFPGLFRPTERHCGEPCDTGGYEF